MEERRKEQQKPEKKKGALKGMDVKRIPPEPSGYITGGENQSTRPEQGPNVPPQERTEGIP